MKHEITPFNYNGHNLSTITDEQGEVWFVAKDVCAVLDHSNVSSALSCLDEDERSKFKLGRQGEVNVINESGLYSLILNSRKPEAKPFKKWVTSEVLPAIRKTGSYSAIASQNATSSAIQPTKEFRAMFGVARLVGMDKNAAAISANQAVTKITGVNILGLLGHAHLEAETQQSLFFTPTELGERLGISGRKFNMLLAEAGLQAKKGEHWAPMATAEGFCRILDTGKRHGDGTMIQQVKWADNVMEIVHRQADDRGAA